MKKLLIILVALGGLGFAGEHQDPPLSLDTFINANLAEQATIILDLSEHNNLSDNITEELLILIYESRNDREAFLAGMQRISANPKGETTTLSDDGTYMCIGPDGTVLDIPLLDPYLLFPWQYCLLCDLLGGECFYSCPVC